MSASVTIPASINPTIINLIDEQPQQESAENQQAAYVDDGKGNHELPEKLKNALKSCLAHYGTDVDKYPRRTEVIDARRQRFYDRGYQYIYFNSSQFIFLPIVAGQVLSAGADSVQMPRYCNVYNIYKPYRRNFQATLCQNPPGVNFEPRDLSQPLDQKIATCAQQYAEHYDVINNTKKLQGQISRLFWTDGRVVTWTRHIKNAQEYGTNEQTGEENGEEVTEVFGVLEAKCFPITANTQKDLTGVILSNDPDVNRAKEDYDWIAEEIKAGESGAGESAFERNCRIGILQGMRVWAQAGDAKANLAERNYMFLRPAAFRHCQEEDRKQLMAIFPEGVQATFISGTYAEAFPVSIDECLTVDHALDGDGMNRPSWGKDLVPVQDAYNNYRNYRQEMHDYGAPWTAYDLQMLDPNSPREWIAQPGEMKGVQNPNQGQPIANLFYKVQADTVPQDMIEAEQDLRDSLAQLITAVQPALFGGQISKDDRVGVYQMAREQAMGVMGLPWGVMQWIFARIKYQAVLAAGKNRREEDVINVASKRSRLGKAKPLSVTVADLKKGNFRAVPDTDSSFPATRAMKKAAFQEFMQAAEFSPALAEAAQQPDNLLLGAELEGLTDLDIPAAKAAERQLSEIEQLLSTGPIPPTQPQVQAAELAASKQAATVAAAQGLVASPLPPEALGPTDEQWADPDFIASGAWLGNKLMLSLARSSVPVDEEDYHQYHALTIKNWFNSDERDKAIDAGNQAGIENIRLHLAEHKKFMAAEQPPMPPPAALPAARPKPPGRGQPAAQAPAPQIQ